MEHRVLRSSVKFQKDKHNPQRKGNSDGVEKEKKYLGIVVTPDEINKDDHTQRAAEKQHESHPVEEVNSGKTLESK